MNIFQPRGSIHLFILEAFLFLHRQLFSGWDVQEIYEPSFQSKCSLPLLLLHNPVLHSYNKHRCMLDCDNHEQEHPNFSTILVSVTFSRKILVTISISQDLPTMRNLNVMQYLYPLKSYLIHIFEL